MTKARAYVCLLSASVWLIPALVLGQGTPGAKYKAQPPQAAAQSVDATTVAQLRTEIHQKLADLTRAKAAEKPDQAKIQQLTKELQNLRVQLRQGGVSAAAGQAAPCRFGGPGLGLGMGRGPGFAAGGANLPAAAAGPANQSGPPGWTGGRGPCGQGLGPCGGACWNCPYAQDAPPANATVAAGPGGRGGRGGYGRGYRGGR